MLLWASVAIHASGQRVLKGLKAKLAEPFDTTRDDGYWKRALAHGKLDVNDSSVTYPKVLGFAVKLYRWGDRTFNSYDTAYVVGSGKRWKLMLKNNNWMDSYRGELSAQDFDVMLTSNVSSNFGVQISYMALSLGYALNVNNLISGKRVEHKKWDFSFTCSRIFMEAYYYQDRNEANLRHFGDYDGDLLSRSLKFSGLHRKIYGLYAYYIFNNKRYAQAAAYCFSKYQKRSAGSFLAGINVSHQNIDMDFSTMPPELQATLPDERRDYRFRYRDYNFLVGYGYSWVFHRNWLYNISIAPGIGYRHSFHNSIDGNRNMLAVNYRCKMALVYNHNRFFYGAHLISDGHLYHSSAHRFFNANHNFNLTAGIRF